MPRMLIVDDDLHLRKLILTYAQLEDFQCREAESSDQAIRFIVSGKCERFVRIAGVFHTESSQNPHIFMSECAEQEVRGNG